MTAANDLAVRRALEAAGVEFIDERKWPGSACERHKNTENANRIGRSRVTGTVDGYSKSTAGQFTQSSRRNWETPRLSAPD